MQPEGQRVSASLFKSHFCLYLFHCGSFQMWLCLCWRGNTQVHFYWKSTFTNGVWKCWQAAVCHTVAYIWCRSHKIVESISVFLKQHIQTKVDHTLIIFIVQSSSCCCGQALFPTSCEQSVSSFFSLLDHRVIQDVQLCPHPDVWIWTMVSQEIQPLVLYSLFACCPVFFSLCIRLSSLCECCAVSYAFMWPDLLGCPWL